MKYLYAVSSFRVIVLDPPVACRVCSRGSNKCERRGQMQMARPKRKNQFLSGSRLLDCCIAGLRCSVASAGFFFSFLKNFSKMLNFSRIRCNYLISIFCSSKTKNGTLANCSSSGSSKQFAAHLRYPSYSALRIVHRITVEDRGGDPRGASVPVVRVTGLVLGGGAVPRWPFQLFLDNVPHHQGRICAAHGDERVVAAQEADAGQHPGVHLRLVKLGARRDAGISEKDGITLI